MKWITIFAFALALGAQERVTFTVENKSEFLFEPRVVTGAPYTAQAVTETTQVLADGNRITRKSSSFVARDSQGRTRREQNLSRVGPWSSPEGSGVVLISDPVAGSRYEMDKNSKVAVKHTLDSNDARERHMQLEAKLKQAARAKKEEAESRAMIGVAITSEPKTATSAETLGTQMIEGVQAVGKRVTETIPAGRIGNEKPIEVVNETWYSQDLQTVVMSKHSDPRSGDVVYTLTNVNRAEPDAALFAVPQDYKIKDEARDRDSR